MSPARAPTTDPGREADPSWAWNLYWHADRIASCMDGPARSNYDDRLAAGWRTFFAGLAEHSRVLDLCTGNGAVALIAAQSDGGHCVTGVDLADIDPLRFVTRCRDVGAEIAFVGNTDAAALPFAHGAFDAVVSQYGIEYSDLDRSLPEAVRVLAAGGRLRLAMHAAEGKVAAEARAMIDDADFLLDEAQLFDRADAAFAAVIACERSDGPAAAADNSFALFKQALASAARYLPDATDKRMVEHSMAVLGHSFDNRAHFDLPVLLAKVEELRTEVVAHRARVVALAEASVSAARLAEIAERLRSLGVDQVATSEQRDESGLLGQVVEASRPAD